MKIFFWILQYHFFNTEKNPYHFWRSAPKYVMIFSQNFHFSSKFFQYDMIFFIIQHDFFHQNCLSFIKIVQYDMIFSQNRPFISKFSDTTCFILSYDIIFSQKLSIFHQNFSIRHVFFVS